MFSWPRRINNSGLNNSDMGCLGQGEVFRIPFIWNVCDGNSLDVSVNWDVLEVYER